METKDNKIYLRHILEEIDRIKLFLSEFSKEEFVNPPEITANHYAVVRSLEIIGEAAAKISSRFKEEHPQVPWRDMTDMRNKITHEYMSVDYATVWETAEVDLPELKKVLEPLL